MCYELVVNRVGAFAKLRRRERAGIESREAFGLPAYFYRTVAVLDNCKFLSQAADKLITVASQEGLDAELLPAPDRVPKIEVSRYPHQASDENTKLVGSIAPLQQMRITLGEVAWRVTAQFSVTACALNPSPDLTKLWISFEALPEDGWTDDTKRKIDETAIKKIIQLTDAMAKAAFPLFCDAYACALQADSADNFDAEPECVIGENKTLELLDERVHVAMIDNDSQNVAELLKVLTLKGKDYRNISDESDKEANSGKTDFEDIARLINKNDAKINVKRIRVFDDDSRITGLYYGPLREDPEDYHIRVIGFGRRRGVTSTWRPYPKTVNGKIVDPTPGGDPAANNDYREYIEEFSAAKKISAILANRIAERQGHILADDFLI